MDTSFGRTALATVATLGLMVGCAQAATVELSNINLQFTGSSGGSASFPKGQANSATALFSIDPLGALDNSFTLSGDSTFSLDTDNAVFQNGVVSAQLFNSARDEDGPDLFIDYTVFADVTIADGSQSEAFGTQSWSYSIFFRDLNGGRVAGVGAGSDRISLSGNLFSADILIFGVGSTSAGLGETSPVTTARAGVQNFEAKVPAVPVPASLPLLAAGLCAFGAIRRRKKVA